jgi:hypothetical protein
VNDTGHLDVVVANAVERIVIGDLPGEELECPDAVDVLADPGDPGRAVPAFARLTVPQLRALIARAIASVDAELLHAVLARRGRTVASGAKPRSMAWPPSRPTWRSRRRPRSGTP